MSGDSSTWTAQTIDQPIPIQLTLRPLADILKAKKYDSKLVQAVSDATKTYCAWL